MTSCPSPSIAHRTDWVLRGAVNSSLTCNLASKEQFFLKGYP